ncbi:arginine--tRNA ligase, chloroplastic/mitochondrial [Tanacetum coccineum]
MIFDTSTMGPFTPSPNRKYNRSSVFPKIKRIFAQILRRCHFQSNSEINAFIRPLEGEALEYGDYVCFNVLEICDELRKKNPDLFDEIKPKDIAMEISRELKLENTDKISRDSIQLHDIGVISFMLHESYIAKRVMKMLIRGIDTCAPVIYESKAKVVFLSRTNIPAAAVDMLRADFIKDALARIFLYSGIDILDEGISPSTNISSELETIKKYERFYNADIIVYITPDLQREHMQPLFTATKSREFQAAVACCGYRCFSRNPKEELYGLWQHYLSRYLSVSELAEDAGYSREGFFVCALKFSFLKRHRLAECGFDIDEILNEEGNTFRYVHSTRALMCSVIKNPRGTCWFELKEALAGKEERELAFHLVQYTGVIEKACVGLVPNFVCEYLFVLSKLFTSCYSKASLNYQLLCKTALVVMDKCFDLLGISPGEEIMSSILSSSVERGPCRELAEARCKYLNSRFEIFSMNVDVADLTLDEYDIFRTISVIDTFGARADGWTMSDENECCFVSSKNRDCYYKICYVPHVESFSDFWARQGKAKSGTLQFESKAGLVGLNYILLKEVVDASIELTFSSPSVVSLQVCSQIIAYYRDGLVKDVVYLGSSGLVLFRTGKSELNGNQVPLEMHKSVVAVPVDGCLMIEAFLMDVKTNKVIVDDMIVNSHQLEEVKGFCKLDAPSTKKYVVLNS